MVEGYPKIARLAKLDAVFDQYKEAAVRDFYQILYGKTVEENLAIQIKNRNFSRGLLQRQFKVCLELVTRASQEKFKKKVHLDDDVIPDHADVFRGYVKSRYFLPWLKAAKEDCYYLLETAGNRCRAIRFIPSLVKAGLRKLRRQKEDLTAQLFLWNEPVSLSTTDKLLMIRREKNPIKATFKLCLHFMIHLRIEFHWIGLFF